MFIISSKKDYLLKKNKHTEVGLYFLSFNVYYDVFLPFFIVISSNALIRSALYSRSWLEMANDEKRTRIGPVCFTEILKRGIHCNIKIIEKLRIRPTFGLIFKTPCRGYDRNGIYYLNGKINILMKYT